MRGFHPAPPTAGTNYHEGAGLLPSSSCFLCQGRWSLAIPLPPANPGSPLTLGWPPPLLPHCRPQFPGQQGHLMESTTGTKQTCEKPRGLSRNTAHLGWLRGDSLLRLPTSLSKRVCCYILTTILTQVHNCLLEIPGPDMCQTSTGKAVRCGHHLFCHNPELQPLTKPVNGAAEKCMDVFTCRGKD